MNQKSLSATSRIDDVDRHVGQRIRMRRIMLGLSQQTLGVAVDVSVQQIQKYEKAHNRVSCGKLYHFSNLLAVPISYFFENIEPQNTEEQHKAKEVVGSEEDFTAASIVHEREILILVRAYNNIADVHVRRKILELVKSLAGD